MVTLGICVGSSLCPDPKLDQGKYWFFITCSQVCKWCALQPDTKGKGMWNLRVYEGCRALWLLLECQLPKHHHGTSGLCPRPHFCAQFCLYCSFLQKCSLNLLALSDWREHPPQLASSPLWAELQHCELLEARLHLRLVSALLLTCFPICSQLPTFNASMCRSPIHWAGNPLWSYSCSNYWNFKGKYQVDLSHCHFSDITL